MRSTVGVLVIRSQEIVWRYHRSIAVFVVVWVAWATLFLENPNSKLQLWPNTLWEYIINYIAKYFSILLSIGQQVSTALSARNYSNSAVNLGNYCINVLIQYLKYVLFGSVRKGSFGRGVGQCGLTQPQLDFHGGMTILFESSLWFDHGICIYIYVYIYVSTIPTPKRKNIRFLLQ